MINSENEFRKYLKSEYSNVDREFIINTLDTKSVLNFLKKYKKLIAKINTILVIKPNSELYSYFVEEYKNNLYFEKNNIIFPITESRMIKKRN